VIKYELVFDEATEGDFLKERVLTKTMATVDNVYLQEDEDEMAEVQDDGATACGAGGEGFLMKIDESKEEEDDKLNTQI
jgi:hypothetical protein